MLHESVYADALTVRACLAPLLCVTAEGNGSTLHMLWSTSCRRIPVSTNSDVYTAENNLYNNN